ncbi:rCG40226 [Rattus norvegicus]|uniref:RCG40226 n=1 Tax=Rattus norvegicus TaxID=10116 RepID=A6I8C6_RAT|nr:rCG40226 [Rattus norvegicus]
MRSPLFSEPGFPGFLLGITRLVSDGRSPTSIASRRSHPPVCAQMESTPLGISKYC